MWPSCNDRRPQSSLSDHTRAVQRWMVGLIVSLSPWGSAVAGAPQSQDDQASTSPAYAELVTVEPKRTTAQDLWRNTGTGEVIRPYLSREDFVALCERLELDQAQLAYADLRFGAYQKRVEQIKEQLLGEIVAPVMEYIQAVEAGKDLSRDRMSETFRFLGRTVKKYQPRSKRLFNALFEDLQGYLSETQQEAYPKAIRAWRRSVMLNSEGGNGTGYDLSLHVDLFDVVDQACRAESALRTLLDRQAEPPSDSTLAEARRQCLELLDTFELALDSLIQRRFSRAWDRFFRSAQAWADGDEEAAQRTSRDDRRGWMKVYRANTRAAETLASIIEESSGPQLAHTWRDRYYTAYYPVLYGQKSTDLVYKWLLNQPDIGDEQQAAVEAIYAQYIESRRALRVHARSMLLRLAKELNLSSPGRIAAYTATTGKVPPRKAQLDEQRRSLSRRTNLQFRGPLADKQRLEFDQAMAKLRRSVELFEF